jgi:uncharacterized protein (DUF305 family)
MNQSPAPWAALAVLVLVACSKGQPAVAPAPHPAYRTRADSSAIAKARADSARHPYTDADVHFMSAMIGHHSQALVMAGWAPSHGASPAVERLAERIINGQQDEIVTMQNWLRDRLQPVPEPGTGGMQMTGSGHHAGHDMLMPGMLTEAQMRQLEASKGREFDRQFLTFMIQHHQGAVTMVKKLLGTTGAAQDEMTFKLATDVNVDQTTEIARMKQMLEGLSPE